jgi:hypothetical protein
VTGFEQGPIRPPSEAASLLVRVTRNCPWNRCAFCPVYKGRPYSARAVEDILADLDQMKQAADAVAALSERMGRAGEVDQAVIQRVYAEPALRPLLPVAWWLAHGGRTVFLQDANALASPRRKVLAVLQAIGELFPRVDRITTYSQSRTLSRKSVELLAEYHEAGLTRVHVGLESGSDAVLEMVAKGCTATMHIEAGRRVLAAGLHLCCYVMPGLGGATLSEQHAQDTAAVLAVIQPSAVRLRSLVVPPRGPMADLVAAGRFVPAGEVEMVAEIRAMLAGMTGVHTRLVSDHDLNLLPELEGELPDDLTRLLGVCDRFLDWPRIDRNRFVLGRRTGIVGQVADLERADARDAIDAAAARMGVDLERPIDEWIQQVRRQMV